MSTTSSSSFELTVRQGDAVQSAEGSLLTPDRRESFEAAVWTDRPTSFRLQCKGHAEALRVLIGDDVVCVLPADQARTEVDVTRSLNELCGEAVVRVEVGEDEAATPLLTVLLPLEAPAHLVALYDALLRELMDIHVGLAQDVLGSMVLQRGHANARFFEPASEVAVLEQHLANLEAPLRQIGLQPSESLEWRRVSVRWRPGDVADIETVSSLIGTPETTIVKRRVARLGRAVVRRAVPTRDIAEHRHLRAGLLSMARRAGSLAEGCVRAAESYRREAREWGISTSGEASIYERRYAPRVRKLEEIGHRATGLSRRFRRLIHEHPYIAGAGVPRTQLGPTPIFMGRPVYRRAFDVLMRARREQGLMVDGQGLELRVRRLDKLYEYWTFAKVVALLRETLGAPKHGSGFEILDEVYRPDLTPGQRFVWYTDEETELHVWYEPAIPPVGWRRVGPEGLVAALVGAPLRPDILLLVRRGGEVVDGMVIDAKSTAGFERRRLFEVSDYRTLIHVERTGRQPVRHAFLVHRTPGARFSSLPGFFEGREPASGVSTLGACPLMPGEDRDIRRILALVTGGTGLRDEPRTLTEEYAG